MKSAQLAVSIPAYNQASHLENAIERALAQTYPRVSVLLVDDASTDATREVAANYVSDKRFCYIRIASSVGAAQSKNLSLLLSKFHAIAFHHPNDRPLSRKLLLQARALFASGVRDGSAPTHSAERGGIDEPGLPHIAVASCRLASPWGDTTLVDQSLALVSDFFPNLSSRCRDGKGARVLAGALFVREVFTDLGGFIDSAEADREFRNRTIARGFRYAFIPEPLHTEVGCDIGGIPELPAVSFGRRARGCPVRRARLEAYRNGLLGTAVREANQTLIDLEELRLDEISNPSLVCINRDIPATAATYESLERQLGLQAIPPPSWVNASYYTRYLGPM